MQPSHPAWGAWIEILPRSAVFASFCRTPHGVRGLKYLAYRARRKVDSRTPHGVRGLKLLHFTRKRGGIQSHPAWGAWIEIKNELYYNKNSLCRTPHGVRGLKLFLHSKVLPAHLSHPAWGAWIEMLNYSIFRLRDYVAPRMGCVD